MTDPKSGPINKDYGKELQEDAGRKQEVLW